jgi:tetratricopeptide (TPR) repeat protein
MVCRVLLLALLFTGTSHAQDFRALARQKFDEARAEFSAHHYDVALKLFQESYRLAPYPDLLFNIGRCHEELGQWRAGLDAYERYLATNPRDEEVRRRSAFMRRRMIEDPEPEPSPEPLPSPQPSPAPLVMPIVIAPPPPAPTPLYKKWWLWTAVVGVAGVALGVGLGVGLSGPEPSRTFPPLGPR